MISNETAQQAIENLKAQIIKCNCCANLMSVADATRLVEEKNELVRENYRLLEEIDRLSHLLTGVKRENLLQKN